MVHRGASDTWHGCHRTDHGADSTGSSFVKVESKIVFKNPKRYQRHIRNVQLQHVCTHVTCLERTLRKCCWGCPRTAPWFTLFRSNGHSSHYFSLNQDTSALLHHPYWFGFRMHTDNSEFTTIVLGIGALRHFALPIMISLWHWISA